MQRFKYELTLLWSGTGIKLALAFYIATVAIALWQGNCRVLNEAEVHNSLQTNFEKNLADWSAKVTDGEAELGLMGYYLLTPTAHSAPTWARLIYGQRDLDLLQQNIRLLALEGQIHASEINNPENQITGFIDLAFIFTYLLPLIIGLMCATLYANEQQTNRWPLLNALAGSGMAVLNYRLGLGFLLLTCLNSAVLAIAILLTNIAFDACAAFIIGSLLLYQFFWFSICGLIIRLGLNTAASTLGFIAAWMVLVVIVPGMSNLYLTHQYATDEGIALTLKQRQFMNDAWDKDKKLALDNFLQHYPQYADTAPLGEAFDWKWYYAMQHLSDLAALPHLEQYHAIMNKRRAASDHLAWLSAPLNFQQILTQVAQTDMTARHDYLLQVRHYHAQLRNFYYARLFYKTTTTEADIAQYPRFVYQPPTPTMPWLHLLVLMLSSIVVLAIINNIGSASRPLPQRYFWRSTRSQ